MTKQMTDFIHHTTLPQNITTWASATPQFHTEIVETGSGFEFRNGLWTAPRRIYRLEAGARRLHDIRQLQDFFQARRGRLYGFLWEDPLDNSSAENVENVENGRAPTATDQSLVMLDSGRQNFGLQKNYGDFARDITTPIPESVILARNGTVLQRHNDYTLGAKGRITLARPLQERATLTAGFKFYVPVRFDSDTLEISRLSETAGYLAAITLIEIKYTHPRSQ